MVEHIMQDLLRSLVPVPKYSMHSSLEGELKVSDSCPNVGGKPLLQQQCNQVLLALWLAVAGNTTYSQLTPGQEPKPTFSQEAHPPLPMARG